MKTGKLILATAALALAATGAQAQTYRADFGTKIVLAGGGVDPVHTVTLTTAAPGTSAITLTFPTSLPSVAGTYVLATDNTGALSWINPATGITMAGDVTGTAGATVVSAINGVALGSTVATAGNILIGSGSAWVSNAMGGDAHLGSDGTLTLQNTSTARNDLGLGSIATQDATNVNITGGTVGGSTAVNTTGDITGGALTANGAVNLDASPNTGGTNNIGNTTSTTTFYGAVSFPAGSVTAASLGLAQNNILVGDNSGHAAAYGPSVNSVLVTDNTNGGTPQWSTSLPSGLTIPSPSISNPSFTGTLSLPAGSVSNADLANSSLTVSAGNGLSGGGSVALGGTTSLTIDDGYSNTWTTGQTFNAGLTVAGGTTNIATTDASNVNIGTAASGTGTNTITIGNATGPSTTTFLGNVSFPAGSVTASSLGLANQNILVGDASGHAAAVAPTANAVLITDATAPTGTPQWSTSLPSGLTIPSPTLTGTINLPAGSVSNTALAHSTIGLTNSDGSITVTGSPISLGSSGSVTLNLANANTWTGEQTLSATGTALNVTTNATVGGTFGVTGAATLGTAVLSNGGTISVNADASDITPGTASSFYFLSNTDATNSHSVGGITLTTPATGTVIQLTNVGPNPISLLNQSGGSAGTQFSIPGGDAIMASGGSATFIYDGTYWHMTASE